MPLEIPVPAKVNLTLHVTGRRPDGHHLLDSLVAFADVGERLHAEKAEGFSLRVEGPIADRTPQGEDNLILRAATLLAERFPEMHGAAFTLHKHIPVASGLGGGSADAAAALKLLLALYGCSLPGEELHAIALSLGADVPMCLWSRPLRASGAGDILAPVVLPSLPLVLVNPNEVLETQDVFAALDREFTAAPMPRLLPEDTETLIDWLQSMDNHLQDAAATLRPEIRRVLNALRARRGCLLARISGSGATCFGLFGDATAAKLAALIINREHPKWWARAVRTLQRVPEITHAAARAATMRNQRAR